MTTSALDWQPHADRLANDLAKAGKLTTPEWRAAVRAIPRHHLVPRFFQQSDGTWREIDSTSPDGLATVYANTVLITALTDTPTGPVIRSSSTQPGLMTRMLEALDPQPGDRVLEIGTGTGYNAALLSHRLDDQAVFSIDVEPDLVDLARARLADLGCRPTLVAGDGAAGLAEHAPFERIIATCAVPTIPWAWVEQARPGGVILTDLKIAHSAGSLVRLTRIAEDRAEGRFDPTYAAFMDLRHDPGDHPRTTRVDRNRERTDAHTTLVDPRTPWNNLVVWFLAAFDLGPNITHGYTGTDTTKPPTASWLATPDGSWAEISLADTDGRHEVVEGGQRRLWSIVERAHQRWEEWNRPGWHRFGLTVTPDRQTVWLDHPDSENTWTVGG